MGQDEATTVNELKGHQAVILPVVARHGGRIMDTVGDGILAVFLSGMIGLPGDITPPSRLVRAVAFSETARPTNDGPETIYEIFRILDNFNLPLGGAEGSGKSNLSGMRSSTIWTTAQDLKNKVITTPSTTARSVGLMSVASTLDL